MRALTAFLLLVAGVAAAEPAAPVRCKPGQPCWPTAADWQRLRAQLKGTLEQPRSPLEPCQADARSAACAAAIVNANNPFYLQDQPGGTQSSGWLGAWRAVPSAYAVVAKRAEDVVAAVRFAREHHLALAVKGTGHDYLGRSNAPDSLLIWTHEMRDVSVQDHFVPHGCGGDAGVPAVTVGAGVRWLEAYQAVILKHGRYVQGGGCTSVGAAGGFSQGGGFGSWSKKYGAAAASMLEAEVVTADGKRVIANACQNQDLFWALRGGGGGTFGVVTRMTMRTHPLPTYLGFAIGRVTARTDAAFKELLRRFVAFYGETLNNEHWGGMTLVSGKNAIELGVVFEGMSAQDAEAIWTPMRAWTQERPNDVTFDVKFVAGPAQKMWDSSFIKQQAPTAITSDPRPGAKDLWWWTANQTEVSTYWFAYQSRYLPADLFSQANASRLADALFRASRFWTFEIHFNKGQAGASPDAVARGRETSMNPAVFRAAGLLIAASTGSGYPGVPGREPDLGQGEAERARVSAAMKIIREVTPGAGTYPNETDYFEPDWQRALWGENYPRLLAIKRKVDPEGLFFCHHCVGSEDAAPDGGAPAKGVGK